MTYSHQALTYTADTGHGLLSALETMLTAHASWTFVEEYVATTVTNRIWKNEDNSWGEDFYVIFSITTAGSKTFNVRACEYWDTTTHRAVRPVYDPGSNHAPSATYAAHSDTGQYAPVYNGTFAIGYTGSGTTIIDYWYLVTRDGLYMATTGGVSVAVGVFEPLFPENTQEFPLFLINMYGEGGGGWVSRRPTQSGVLTPDCFSVHSWRPPSGSGIPVYSYTFLMGSLAGAPSGRALYGGAAVGGRPLIAYKTQSGGQYRGLWRDGLLFDTGTNHAIGDTATVDGVEWVCFNQGSYSPAPFFDTTTP